MNRLLHFLVLLMIFSLQSEAQNMDENNLIPRTELFNAVSFEKHALNPAGNLVFYAKSDNLNELGVWSVDGQETLQLKNETSDWWPTNQGLMAICNADSMPELWSWNFKQWHQIELPVKAKSLAIIQKSQHRNDNWILQLQGIEDEDSGLYAFNSGLESFQYLYPLQSLFDLRFDDNLNLVAGMARGSGNTNLLYVWSEYDEWEIIDEAPWDETQFLGGLRRFISVSDDGQFVYFTSNTDRDKYAVFEYDRSRGVQTLITESQIVDLIPFSYTPSFDGSPGAVVGLYAKTLREFLDAEIQSDFEFLTSKIEGDISFVTASEDNNIWLLRENSGGPENFFLFNRKSRRFDLIHNAYPELEKYEMAERYAFEVASFDGLKLPIHVYLPPGSDQDKDGIPDEPLPTILYVHGGPWVGIVHWNQYFHWRNFQLLANRGYAVINCEFRGASGYGKEFIDAANKEWGEAMTMDKKKIAEWAVEHGIAKNDKLGIWGWSYGGYAALAGLAFHPETYACGISMYGISDLVAFNELPFASVPLWMNRVGDPSIPQERKKLFEQSPINFVENIRSPVLLTIGSLDERVPQIQVDSMAEALYNAGADVQYFYYPQEVHDYLYSSSWISFWSIAEKFLARNLGGNFQMDGGDEASGELLWVFPESSK